MKRLVESDADAPEDAAPPPTKKTLFTELQLAAAEDDPADGIDDEVPGALPVDQLGVEPVVLDDKPFVPYTGRALTESVLASDPGYARAQRQLARTRTEERRQVEGVEAGEEQYDQPAEKYNEAGDPIEPFNLRREREEGMFDAEGSYIAFDPGEERDAWLDTLDPKVAGTGEGQAGMTQEGPAAEPEMAADLVAEPPPLGRAALDEWARRLVRLLQPGESAEGAMRRLAGGGATAAKFSDKERAQGVYRARMYSGHSVAEGNLPLFEQITEAAEVLFDGGHADAYSATREELQRQLEENAAAAGPATSGGAGAGGPVFQERHELFDELAMHHLHKQPVHAAPSAADEPPMGGHASVPSANVQSTDEKRAAVLGFAAAAEADAQRERGEVEPLAPPQEMEQGLGSPAASPTGLELGHKGGS